MSTVFEKIIEGEIPKDLLYEDEHVIAFLSIQPVNKGHALVIPKNHFENIFDGDPQELGYMMQAAQKVAMAVKEVTQADGINITMNNGAAAGQEVFHAHIHIIPRFKGDNAWTHAHHKEYAEDEEKKFCADIKNAIH